MSLSSEEIKILLECAYRVPRGTLYLRGSQYRMSIPRLDTNIQICNLQIENLKNAGLVEINKYGGVRFTAIAEEEASKYAIKEQVPNPTHPGKMMETVKFVAEYE